MVNHLLLVHLDIACYPHLLRYHGQYEHLITSTRLIICLRRNQPELLHAGRTPLPHPQAYVHLQ